MVGKSLLINTTERLRRISITDPSIAFAQVITPTQILVHGKTPGEVSLLIWDEAERSRSFDLRVDVDVSACAEEERRVFPDGANYSHTFQGRPRRFVWSRFYRRMLPSAPENLAGAYSPLPGVVNVLTFGPVGAQEVLLQVKFAEVRSSSASTQLGINFSFPREPANTIGTVTDWAVRRLWTAKTLTPGQSGGSTTSPYPPQSATF